MQNHVEGGTDGDEKPKPNSGTIDILDGTDINPDDTNKNDDKDGKHDHGDENSHHAEEPGLAQLPPQGGSDYP